MTTTWPIAQIGDVFSIARGGSPRPINHYFTDDPNGVNWVLISDAAEGSKYIRSTKKRIRAEGMKSSRLVKPGDFLLTNSMSFGRPYIMQTSGCIHDGWLVLSPHETDVSPDFFYHLLSSNLVYSQFERLAAGATVKNLSIDLVKHVEVPVPPLSEQLRIAAILDKADELREKRRALITTLDSLADSVFNDLFGDPAKNPNGWPVRQLSEIALEKPANGVFRKNSQYSVNGEGGTIPVVWVEELFRGNCINTSMSRRMVPTSEEVRRYGLRYGDLLFCRSSLKLDGIAFNNVYLGPDNGALFECHLIRLRPNLKAISPVFLNSLLRTPQMRAIAKSRSKTATMTTIDQISLGSIPIIVPPLALQNQFAVFIESTEKLRKAHVASLAEMNRLFASLQQRAFQGNI